MSPDPYDLYQTVGPAPRDLASAGLTPDVEVAASQGPFRWWYQLAAPRVTSARPSLAERELLRRGRLAATLIFAIMVLGIINIPVAATNPSPTELYGDIGGLIGCVIALALNRSGSVTLASVLLATLLEAGFAGIILTAPGGLTVPDLLLMPLLALTELIAVSLLAPLTVFLVAIINSVFVLVVILEWPADSTIHMLLNQPGAASLIISPPITLYLIVALVTYLWVRGATQALVARDRAEDIAALEHAVAEQRRSLEIGMRQIHDTLVRVANGDYTARAPIAQDSVLWQLGASLNTMIARQQKVSDAQYQLQRASLEVNRLVEAVRQAKAGRPPLWPAPMGTVLDPLIREFAGSSAHGAQPGLPPALPYGATTDYGQRPDQGYGRSPSYPHLPGALSGQPPGQKSGPMPGQGASPGPIPGLPIGWDTAPTTPHPTPDAYSSQPLERPGSPFDPGYPDLDDQPPYRPR
jgi:HAMP domain-containing protein